MCDLYVNSFVLRVPEVVKRTGLSRSTIRRRVDAGDFPVPRSLGGNSKGWIMQEVDDWIRSLPFK